MKYFIVFCLLFYTVLAKHELYDGHSVYEVNVNHDDATHKLHALKDQMLLDIWSYPHPGKPGEVLVPKTMRKAFEEALDAAGVQYEMKVENVKELLELEDQKFAEAAARNNTRVPFNTIITFDEVNAYMADLARRFPNRASLELAGASVQGRPIYYLRISTTNFQDTRKPIVMIQSLLHAREWVTLPVALYSMHKLLVDVTEPDLVNNVDWIILPVANPDGYVWSHTNARFWRKNRRTGLIAADFCVGVDLNRNFDVNWGEASSSWVCDETFHGPGPMSEPENQAIGNIFGRYRGRIGLYMDMHSFGSIILFGYGNGSLPANALTLNMVGVRMAQAIDRVKWDWKPNYVVGNVVAILYYASGGSSDFAMVAGIPLSYTYELPAYRNINWLLNGFLVDPEFIPQVGFETWEGIKQGARYLLGG